MQDTPAHHKQVEIVEALSIGQNSCFDCDSGHNDAFKTICLQCLTRHGQENRIQRGPDNELNYQETVQHMHVSQPMAQNQKWAVDDFQPN